MANHGGVGAKFVSVNLNKSYGQSSHHNYPPYNGSYGPAGTNRARPGSHASAGGGMVLLSRNHPLQKAVPKLSVPPPLNLPSLRKEHEKFDLSGSGGGAAGGAGSGSGSRPTSSGMGWTKPGTIALQEKEGSGDARVVESVHDTNGATKGSGTYMPPSARFGGGLGHVVVPSAQSYPPPVEKAVVLRGEDFPSLRAALPTSSVPAQKPKDDSFQKQKQLVNEESSNEQRDSFHLSSTVHMRPQGQSSHGITNGLSENGGQGHKFGGAHIGDHSQKQEDPLPVVHLNPRSDWADDERDTSHGFAVRDPGFPKSEAYWEREFDMPRSSILPHKPPNNLFERWGQRSNETGKGSTDVLKLDPYRREVSPTSRGYREGNTWRNSSIQKDGFSVPEVINDRSDMGRPTGFNRDAGKDKTYISASSGDNTRHSLVTGNRDSVFGRRDMGHGQQGGQHWNHTVERFGSRGSERHMRDRYGSEQSIRYRGDAFQNSTASKSSFSWGGKRLPMNDPLLNFGREKRAFSKTERPYLEDPYPKDFSSTEYDERDPFSGNLVGLVKKKKDVVKADFHDPVRESFEAELERVQKMQDMERQRIIEEQERALEQARREEEEKQRLIREEADRRRRMEEEAREAAWRAEREKLEAIRKAEEQKIAREEEKRRIFFEEERRKQAAKQKLIELEARIAKRQAEVTPADVCINTVADEEVSASGKEKEVSIAADPDSWEDNERMVERITASAISDSSIVNTSFEMISRPHPSSNFVDRGKPVNPCRRDVFENGNNSSFPLHDQESDRHSPRRDTSIGGREFPRKEFYGGGGFMSSRTFIKGGMQEPNTDGFAHLREHRWKPSEDGDPYNKNRDSELEFYENVAEKYGDIGWGQGNYHSSSRSLYPDRLYLNSESDELYSYGRSRYSMRQPRVLPPPSLASVHKTSLRGENELSGPSTSLENDARYNRAARSESTVQTGYYDGHLEKLEQSGTVDVQQEITTHKLDNNATPRCDSQSSLSVSSPPSSPTHLSHDELDESADSAVISTAAEGKEILLSGNEPEVLNEKSGTEAISAGEDEDWSLENNEETQEQEEYDEDDDGYQEEDEVHEGDDENIDLTQEFEHMHLEDKSSSNVMDNLVLGFNEGVEVGIPGDEFERNSRREDNIFGIPEVSVGVVEEEQEYVDEVGGDGQILQPLIHEPQKTIQNSVFQPVNASHTSTAPDLLDSVAGSSGSSLSAQHTVPSSVDMALHSSSGQATMSALSPVPSQADLPVKLQFGLFSGPSLIPSPIPAIQIGSIQMPLHLHSPVGPSISHIHPSQPPLFQFGQLRYTSPVSQGILPMAPQPMSFVQPNIHTHYNLNQNSGGSLPIQLSQGTSTLSMMKDDVPSLSVDNQSGVVSTMQNLSHENWSRGLNTFPVRGSAESKPLVYNNQNNISHAADNRNTSKPGSRAEEKGHHDTVVKNHVPSLGEKGSEGLLQFAPASSKSVPSERDFTLSKAPGPIAGNKGKRNAYSVRNSSLRSSYPAFEASGSGSNEFQRRPRRPIHRTEFRVRENVDRRHTLGLVSNNSGLDDKPNSNGNGVGTFTRSGFRRGTMSTKPVKQMVESESLVAGPISSQEFNSESRTGKGVASQALTRSQGISRSGEANLKRNISEEDVDAPLQSGIVRVFKQPGIEAPSDEDDFIEVRSKRQMLNDRREQREKEIKAKSRVTKLPLRKSRPSVQGTMVSTSSNKIPASLGGDASNNIRSDFVSYEGRGLVNKEVSTDFSTMVSQPLAPIGTPAVNTDALSDLRSHTNKSLQTGSVHVISSGGKDLGPNPIFEKNKVLDNVQTSLGAWGNPRFDQQVMSLTQTQLDEAMKPVRFDTQVTSIRDHNTSVSEPILQSSSILTKDKPISSSASPINSLLAGEKIQFGAVTSPTIIPSSSRVVSHGIGPPGSFRSDIKISQNLSKSENDSTFFFEKDKHTNESGVLLEDCEAEAEAAASAVAAAAISTDEIIGNGLGSVHVSDTKSFVGADVDGISGGVAGDQQSGSQLRAEESLSVSLPADLSVETPPISWPPLPSPQSSSTHMLSHFPGGPPSHFPFYDMNHPMLGGQIFAFGPHEEAGGTQSQSQTSTVSGSGHVGAWQQAVDSFYGPPSGYTGPFISPPGGIPGVQAPPHMVVYNHYAPVGQFGQVGLSFMGAAYIPSGKQPDWKHNPTSSAMGIGEGEMNAMNMVSAQRNPPNMPPPFQHLGPGSPLLPMASPFAMFDVPPFQTAPEMSVQARWSHVPASALPSVPMSLPLQLQAEGVMPSQYSSHGHPVEQSLTPSSFSEPQTTTLSDNGRPFPMGRDAKTVTQFPDELGLVDSLGPTVSGTSTLGAVIRGSSGSTISNAEKTHASSTVQSTNAFKTRHPHPKNLSAQPYNSSGSYGYERGGASLKNSSVREWSHQRRMGFHGRNQSLGAEKSLPSSKMKQIYVAKQTSHGSSSSAVG